MFGTLIKDTIDRISFEQIYFIDDDIKIFDNYGSRGNSLI
jgi:hypothetical protein